MGSDLLIRSCIPLAPKPRVRAKTAADKNPPATVYTVSLPLILKAGIGWPNMSSDCKKFKTFQRDSPNVEAFRFS